MKKNKQWLTVILLVLITTISKAQVSYFGMEADQGEKLEAFKKTTTLFTFQYADYAELESFTKAIEKTWTITPFKIIKPSELSKYNMLGNYSLFYIDAFSETVDTTTNINVVYTLKLIAQGKNPKETQESVLFTVNLYPDIYTTYLVREIGGNRSIRRGPKSDLLNQLYNSSKFYNWSPGFLAAYLKQINDGLTSAKSQYLDFQFYNKTRLPEIANETLYVPDYVRRLFSAAKAAGSKNYSVDPPQERYPYKLKFALYSELDSLILNNTATPIKYVIYTQRSNDKIISVYDTKDNRIIYQKFTPNSKNFEMSDLNQIKNTIISIK